MITTETDLTHAHWLVGLGARGVHAEREKQSTASLPDRWAALRGLEQLAKAGELDTRTARRFVVGAWTLFDPHPTRLLLLRPGRQSSESTSVMKRAVISSAKSH